MRQCFLSATGAALFTIMAIVSLTEGATMPQLEMIKGTVSYRERMALKPGSILEVELLDISLQDVPAQRLASIRIRPSGNVPIPFTIGYDPAMIESNHTYAVSAKIMLQEKVLFRSDTNHPVLTRGAGNTVDILMVSTAGLNTKPPAPMQNKKHSNLAGTTWVAENIDVKGVMDDLQSTITFTADGQVHGSGGCNQFRGSYAFDGKTLKFGQLASTTRACLSAIEEQETRFHQALEQTRGYRIDKGLLFLVDGNGRPTMRLWKLN